MLGYTKEELLGTSIFSYTDQEEFAHHIRTSPEDQNEGAWGTGEEVEGMGDRERMVEVENMREGDVVREVEKVGIHSSFEAMVKRKDGTSISVLVAVSPLASPEGLFTGNLCVFIDISERIVAEERIRSSLREKEVMLKEIHHRVKNNLQVVSSLLYLQSEKLKDVYGRSMLRESQNRVKSMALVHERLYQSDDLARIEFAEYIRNLSAHLFHSFGLDPVRITLSTLVDEVFLSIETAIPCGLIINELVSNSLKHAFPEEMEGVITIMLSKGQEGTLTLIVKDNGVGLPGELDFRDTESMGLHLVMTLIKQLGATIELDRSEGAAYEITFMAE